MLNYFKNQFQFSDVLTSTCVQHKIGSLCNIFIKDNDRMPHLFDPIFTRLRGMGYFMFFKYEKRSNV